jgi:predicted AlkP superfamily phosphohydrolase/phosphomutase
MARVFILGWDGATFDLIKPWVAEGRLPTVARLLREGAHGPLRSTQPPMTFPAWSSFLTGKNPGKHGIYDFTRRLPGTYRLEFLNGGQRREPSFWRLLSAAGRAVTAVSIPCTYPPEPVNGVMISGFDTPGTFSVGPRGMYPPELCQEIEKAVGHPHPIGASITKEINQDRPDLALDKTLRAIREKADTAKYLATSRPWDCFMVLFGESDSGGHYFWKYCDPKSPLFVEHATGVRDALLKIYEELDRQAGELLALLPADTTVLMMSDHGFGGVSNCLLYPNCWLRQQGFVTFRGRGARFFTRFLEAAKLRALSVVPVRLRRALWGKLNRFGPGKLEARVRYGLIDWPNTRAYFDENPYYPFLWVNLKGRQPKGTVAPGREYEELRDRLLAALEEWRHPETGERVVERAWRREEVYSGPAVDGAPDVVVKWGLHRGYNYAFKLSAKSRDLGWWEYVDPNRPESLPFFTGKSGHHRDDGIFVTHGPGIRPGLAVDGARIIDLAPTVLRLQGVAVPADVDGRVLEEVFPDAARPAAATPAAAAPAAAGADATYSADEEERIAERLRALGYVE